MLKDHHKELFSKLNKFITKYYLNKLIEGVIYFFSILFIFFIAFSILEHFGKLGVNSRTFLFWSYICFCCSYSCYLIVSVLNVLNGKTKSKEIFVKII